MKAILIENNIPFDVVDIEGETLPTALAEQGYKLYDPTNNQPAEEITLTAADIATFKCIEQVFIFDEATQIYSQRYEKKFCPLTISKEIARRKQELRDLDYLNSKNEEYDALGLPLPYSWQEIHDKKQPIRNAINGLEQTLERISH